MDYQSNNQSGNPQNTGEPYNNTSDGKDPYNNTPVNNGDSYGNIPANNGGPYPNTPYNNGNSYNNIPNSQNPYGNTPGNNGTPYHNANQYNNPYNNGNPYHNPYYNNGYPYGNVSARALNPRKKGESLATASMVLGIISLISLLLLRLYIPFLLGGVGIILAILSKGGARKMMGKAKAGLICCISGLALDITLCVFSVYLVLALPDIMPEMVDEINQMCEEQYGMSYEEILDEIYEMWDIER